MASIEDSLGQVGALPVWPNSPVSA